MLASDAATVASMRAPVERIAEHAGAVDIALGALWPAGSLDGSTHEIVPRAQHAFA